MKHKGSSRSVKCRLVEDSCSSRRIELLNDDGSVLFIYDNGQIDVEIMSETGYGNAIASFLLSFDQLEQVARHILNDLKREESLRDPDGHCHVCESLNCCDHDACGNCARCVL